MLNDFFENKNNSFITNVMYYVISVVLMGVFTAGFISAQETGALNGIFEVVVFYNIILFDLLAVQYLTFKADTYTSLAIALYMMGCAIEVFGGSHYTIFSWIGVFIMYTAIFKNIIKVIKVKPKC